MLWSDESLNVERECEFSCLAACFPVMEETGHLLRGSRVRSLTWVTRGVDWSEAVEGASLNS